MNHPPKSIDEIIADPDELFAHVSLLVLVLSLVLMYANALVIAVEKWSSPQYSHGWLVPVFALVLLWMRREALTPVEPAARWVGMGVLIFGLTVRLVATHLDLILPDMGSSLICLAGGILMIGGWRTIRWAWPVVLFLGFMFPLPDIMERGVLDPLQRVATTASCYALQTLGLPAFQEGNRISLGDLQMGVVDACSGLRMLTIFMALAFAIVLLSERPLWERGMILVSSIPIALIVNVVRITVTGVLMYATNGGELANIFFHEWAGWFMMPLALGFLYIELVLLSHLIVAEDSDVTGLPFDVRGAPPSGTTPIRT